jgi:hypothetical protein
MGCCAGLVRRESKDRILLELEFFITCNCKLNYFMVQDIILKSDCYSAC